MTHNKLLHNSGLAFLEAKEKLKKQAQTLIKQ